MPHSADNIQLVCKRVNLGKSKFSDEEFRVWAKEAFTWAGQPRSLQDINHSRNDNEGTEDEEEEEEKEEWEEAEAEEAEAEEECEEFEE
jgi:Ran GTPase-activating protein (RanGAP) involved in mRNA processing and transport